MTTVVLDGDHFICWNNPESRKFNTFMICLLNFAKKGIKS